MSFLFFAGGHRLFGVQDPFFLLAVHDRVFDDRGFHVKGEVEKPGAVGPDVPDSLVAPTECSAA